MIFIWEKLRMKNAIFHICFRKNQIEGAVQIFVKVD